MARVVVTDDIIDEHIGLGDRELAAMMELAVGRGLGYADGAAFNIHAQVGLLSALLAIAKQLRGTT